MDRLILFSLVALVATTGLAYGVKIYEESYAPGHSDYYLLSKSLNYGDRSPSSLVQTFSEFKDRQYKIAGSYSIQDLLDLNNLGKDDCKLSALKRRAKMNDSLGGSGVAQANIREYCRHMLSRAIKMCLSWDKLNAGMFSSERSFDQFKGLSYENSYFGLEKFLLKIKLDEDGKALPDDEDRYGGGYYGHW